MEVTRDELVRMYVEEERSLREVGDQIGKTASGVAYLLKKFDIPSRSKSQSRLLALRKGKFGMFDYHDFNRGFFKEWNPKSAYMLGLSFADAGVSSGTLAFTFGRGSMELAYNIAELMGSSNEPKKIRNNGYPAWRITFSSVGMIEDMERMGMPVGARSLTKNFPELPVGMEPHFVRGYFDGNGSVGSQLVRIYTGSRSFAGGLRQCVEDCILDRFDARITGGRVSVDKPRVKRFKDKVVQATHENYIVIYASFSDRANLYHWFYDDAPPYTWSERKRGKWASMIGADLTS